MPIPAPPPGFDEIDPDEIERIATAIRSIEGAGGDPKKEAPDKGLGHYQFMPKTWGQATAAYAEKYKVDLTAIDPNDSEWQHKVAKNQIEDWTAQGYTPKEIASLWNSGNPNPYVKGSGVNKYGVAYDAPGYVRKFDRAYRSYRSQAAKTSKIPDPPEGFIPIEDYLGAGDKIMVDTLAAPDSDLEFFPATATNKEKFAPTSESIPNPPAGFIPIEEYEAQSQPAGQELPVQLQGQASGQVQAQPEPEGRQLYDFTGMQMEDWERASSEDGVIDAVGRSIRKIPSTAKEYVAGTGSALESFLNIPFKDPGIAGVAAELGKASGAAAQEKQAISKEAPYGGKRLWDNPEVMAYPGYWIENSVDTALSMVPTIAGYLTGGKVVAGVIGGSMELSSFYTEMINDPQNPVDPKTAAMASVAYGITSGILNSLGIDAIFGGKEALKQGARAAAKRAAIGALGEGVTEYAEEPAQAVFESLARGEDPKTAALRLADSLKNVESLIFGGLMGGGASVIAGQGGRAELPSGVPQVDIVEPATQVPPVQEAITPIQEPVAEVPVQPEVPQEVAEVQPVQTEEHLSDQEKSYREWEANYQKVMDDPTSASEKNLIRAQSYLQQHVLGRINERIQNGETGLEEVSQSLETELEGLKAQERLRRDERHKKEAPSAQEIRSTQEQVQHGEPGAGNAPEEGIRQGAGIGGENLQRNEEAGPEAGNGPGVVGPPPDLNKTVPEKPETLQGQVNALKGGTVPVVMFPESTPQESIPDLPAGMRKYAARNVPGAGTYYFDPNQIKRADIIKAAKAGTHGELLGHVQSKEEAIAGEQPVVVQATKAGVPLQDSVVDGQNQEAIEAQKEVLGDRFPGSEVKVTTPEEVVGERVGKEPWMMTRSEYEKANPEVLKGQDEKYPAHKVFVQRALSENETVPKEVLADYPDLAPKAVDSKGRPKAQKTEPQQVTVSPLTDSEVQEYESLVQRGRAERTEEENARVEQLGDRLAKTTEGAVFDSKGRVKRGPLSQFPETYGVEYIQGYTAEDQAIKDKFHADAKSYLRNVHKALGWEKDEIKSNPAGPAVSGEIRGVFFKPGSNYGVYIDIRGMAQNIPGVKTNKSGIGFMYRATTKTDKYGGFQNRWADWDTTAERMAELVKTEVERHEAAGSKTDKEKFVEKSKQPEAPAPKPAPEKVEPATTKFQIGDMVRPHPGSGISQNNAGKVQHIRRDSNGEEWIKTDKTGNMHFSENDWELVKPEESKPVSAPHQQVADWVKTRVRDGKLFTSKELFTESDKAYGGTQAEAKYTVKDAYDAMELGINQYIADHPNWFESQAKSLKKAQTIAGDLRALMKNIPTQSKRTAEMDEFQQFSTPPPLAFAAAWAANIQKDDTVLEPSAGIGGLAVFAKNAGAKVIVNEFSPRRLEFIKQMGFDRVFNENAEQINNILPANVKPSVVLMNPPFSATAGRITGKRDTKNAESHVEQALARLEDGGRLVAIVGRGMALDAPSFKKFWDRIGKKYVIRADIGVSGKEYSKYGTTFDNRLIVIDKIEPGDYTVVTGEVENAQEALTKLEDIRNDRQPTGSPRQIEQQPAKPTRAESTQAGKPEGAGGRTPRPATDVVGIPERETEGQRPEPSGLRGAPSDVEPGGRKPPSDTDIGKRTEPAEPKPEDKSGTTGVRPDRTGEKPDERYGTVRAVEEEAPLTKEEIKATQSDEAIYDRYRPTVTVQGAKQHPGNLVESAAMASVNPPKTTYKPSIPKNIIETGKLSDAQLENIIRAGAAHESMLENGQRRGYFIGDGTGVGKGREIAGIFLDNWNRGRKKSVWLSANSSLLHDAQRDVKGIGDDPGKVFPLGGNKGIKTGVPIKREDGILFGTYDLLKRKSGERGEENYVRMQQIADWLGKDFDGVIVFDEAHKMGNAIQMEGTRGKTEPSSTALAGIELQKILPNARIVYVSATGATEVMNLGYLSRLGLWGPGTSFPTVHAFINEIQSGGIAAMELVSRDLKAMGMYHARSLSYHDVSYERMEHPLTTEQKDIYNKLAEAWQVVLNNVNDAIEMTGGKRGAAMSSFWGAHQRFFNQIITSLQMPTILNGIHKDLDAGNSVVLQIVNTNEASLDRKLAAMTEEETLDDLDMTPRDQLMQYVERSFPVQQYEEYEDDNGNVRMRPVIDSQGKPVLNSDAVAMRDRLLDELGSIRAPDGPLDMVLNEFGAKSVAEVTGRTQRVIQDSEGKRVRESRNKSKTEVEAAEFQDRKRRILIFSNAGGTGLSYHADLNAKNQQKRVHYLVQPGWQANAAVQGFGRTHRTNQAQAPHYVLVTTDLKGQKRFISSIARRLDQLGALTKGQRETGGQGFFDARDNLESQHANDALKQFFRRIYQDGEVRGLTLDDFEKQTGLRLTNSDGNLTNDLPSMQQFLNRLLSLGYDSQNAVFDAFSEDLDRVIEREIQNGTLDRGIENLKGDKVTVANEQVVHTDEKTGAETKYVEIDITNPVTTIEWSKSSKLVKDGYYQNVHSGRIWAAGNFRYRTAKSGEIESEHPMTAPTGTRQYVSQKDLEDSKKWKRLDKADAEKIWMAEHEAAPKTITERKHMISGVILPIWNRLYGNPRVLRVVTQDGKKFLGRIIAPNHLRSTLENLGATGETQKYTASEAFELLGRGYTLNLANKWHIRKAQVSGEQRFEIIGPEYSHLSELESSGVFTERINWKTRFFIPTGTAGTESLGSVTKNRPIIEAVAPVGRSASVLSSKSVTRRAIPPVPATITSKALEIRDEARRSEIIKRIQKAFDIPIRQGRFRQRALGIYKQAARVIRTRKANDVEIVFHEIGHDLHNLMGFPRRMPQEVQNLAYEGAKSLNREGFAEFVRLYATNQAEAQSRAPQFYSEFEQRLEERPDVQEAIVTARQAWEEYVAAPTIAKGMSLIVSGTDLNTRTLIPTFNEIYTALVDELHPIKVVVDAAAKKLGRKLPDRINAHLIAWLNRGWARKAEQFAKWGTFKVTEQVGYERTGPSLREILEPIEKAGQRKMLDWYLVAKRAVNDPRILKGFEGVYSEDDFQYSVDELEPLFSATAKKLYEYNESLLRYLVDSGRISEDSYKSIKERNLFYTPLYRVIDVDSPAKGLSKKKFGSVPNPIKKLTGSSRDIISPTENILFNTYAMINAAERNKVGEALIEISKIDGMGEFLEKLPPALQSVKIGTDEALEIMGRYLGIQGDSKAALLKGITELGFTEDDLPEVIMTFRPNYTPKGNETVFYNKGEPEIYELAPELHRAIVNIDPITLGYVGKLLSFPAKMLRAGATLTLEFAARNPMRDQFSAFIYSKYGYIPFWDMAKGIAHIVKKDTLYQQFNASGAAHAALVSLDRNYLGKSLDDLLRSKGILATTKNIIRHPVDALRALSELTEEATRVGEYGRAVKKEGTSEEGLMKAAQAARDVTLDFSRIGSQTKFLNAIIAFWNAQVQGADKMARAFKERPAQTSLKVVLSITIPSILLWLAQHDDPFYEEVPQWRKTIAWNIVTHKEPTSSQIEKARKMGKGLHVIDGDKTFWDGKKLTVLQSIWSIPKPFEVGILFGSFPEAMLEWWKKNDPQAAKDTAKSLLGTISPGIVPTAGAPIIEWFANKSIFFDRPIVPRGREALKQSMQYGPRTSETWKLIAQGLEKTPFEFIANPAKLENLFRGYTGGLGMYGVQSIDRIIREVGADKLPVKPADGMEGWPGLRGFMMRFPSASTASIERFYRKYERAKTEWESKKEEQQIRGLSVLDTKFKVGTPDHLKVLEAAAKAMAIQRKIADITYKNPKLSAEKKRDALDQMYMGMINTARNALNFKMEDEKKPSIK